MAEQRSSTLPPAYAVEDAEIGSDDMTLDDDYPVSTPLDRTIDRIGMGNYQWALLTLCGMGWFADNMWLQAVAIILPRVQRHYDVSDEVVGLLSTATFAGMMFGAIGWGTCSDFLGRTTAFNLTLCFTTIFGIIASFMPSFKTLAFSLFLLGSSVGGSMPTDGTLLLEQLPKAKHYLLTAMSVFFSLGAVWTSIIALFIIPPYSCTAAGTSDCDVDAMNNGWKYLLMILSAFTGIMFLCRIIFFRLHESPRFLVATGRPQEALVSLRKINKFNGGDLLIEIGDVSDQPSPAAPASAYGVAEQPQPSGSTPPSYDSVGELPHPVHTSPIVESTPESPRRLRVRSASEVTTASMLRRTPEWIRPLPRIIRRPLLAAHDRLEITLSPEWRKTTLLVWAIWLLMSLGYTMVNVYMPKLLERRVPELTGTMASNPSLLRGLSDLLVYTTAGIPGPLLGAWLVELPGLGGRRGALAISTFGTCVFYGTFTLVTDRAAVWASTIGCNIGAATMWAVLYGMTPELFETAVRGTACGTASALSRIGGMAAPLLGGWLLVLDPAFTVYVSIGVLFCAGVGVLFLNNPGEHDSADTSKSDYRPLSQQ
ncbi:MFS general substrate transporter [Auriculariales sp. MPI-PUGE-AT-0066]|nr:MFS general substrate transporter [Auriculariales sp. MPI-PUGE-AT-0066]